MNVLSMKLLEKTYVAGKITAFASKEALKIQEDAIEIAETAKKVQENTQNISLVKELISKLEEINARKTYIICEVYNNKFTPDELENSLSLQEIDGEINKIVSGVTGIITKN